MTTVESKRHEKLLVQAKEAFASHEISKQSDGRWRLQVRHDDGKWTLTMLAEVISLADGELYVGGDIDFIIFGYYSDKRCHESKVRWMGECTDVGYYVAQKAYIGTGGALTEVWDKEVAHDELKSWLTEFKEEDRDEDSPSKDAVELRSLFEEWEDFGFPEGEHQLMDELWGKLSSDTLSDRRCPGTVLACRVYYAHAALARLCELLDAEDLSVPKSKGSSPVRGLHRCRGRHFPPADLSVGDEGCCEDNGGRLWFDVSEGRLQLNFCPYCGYEARTRAQLSQTGKLLDTQEDNHGA